LVFSGYYINGAKKLSVLTVSDSSGFAEKGVVINLYKSGIKTKFEINRNSARESGLKISSKLYKLARIVE